MKKTVLPLSHAERLTNHMSVFTKTLNGLQDLELEISEDLTEAEESVAKLTADRKAVKEAIERVKRVTG